MSSNVDTLRDNVNQLETRFNQLREDIISKLNECSDCIKSAKQLYEKATEMTTDLENKLANALNEEKEWKDIKVATTSIKGMVILNVGGDKYTTTVDTLTRVKDTFFTALFSEQWEVERDPVDKSILIDRDGKLFHHILSYMRTNKVPADTMNNESLRQLLITEAEYFRLHTLIDILAGFPSGTLLQQDHKVKLNEFYGKPGQRWELIYKASRDGFDAKAFHSRCDNKGPTMTIIQSNNNYIFGGYTSVPWASNSSYKNDTTAFLFTLTNPHNILPTKYLINSSKTANAVRHSSNYGAIFGASYDIYVANNSNSNKISGIGFPNTYIDTTEMGNNTFTGAKYFTASDIEVFKLA